MTNTIPANQIGATDMEITMLVWAFVFLLVSVFFVIEHLVGTDDKLEDKSVEELTFLRDKIDMVLSCKK